MIGDRAGLVSDLKALVARLEDDIRARIGEVPELRAYLADEHRKAADAQRTAMSVEEWREGEITQAAVAWVLACVFVRFLEDNGLIDSPLISGAGDRRTAALGHREEHFREHPEHSDREYLESVFERVASHPAVASLYDRRHNPLWQLGPTADGARELREFWTRIDPDTGALAHDFTDPTLGSRFLGDLYQDLSETAKKRYALHQTPEFIEEFILGRTLDPAIEEFGLDQVRMIDPTCGSGHFLIGAFERLFARWRDREPGTAAEVLAQRALDAVHGVDLNPFATAIARFRLLVTALRACGIGRLAEAPDFRLNLATGDSLLHGAEPGQFEGFGHYREGIRHVFETEDADELQRILGQGYHAVVGNPPYIAVVDSALRDAYRERYESCHGKYVLTVPFMERFFDLARPEAPGERGVLAGFVGKITGNNFMKREFGAPLVERFLPSVDLQTVVDTSGVPVPGHGTPTVLIFGRSRAPATSSLRVLDGVRGEPLGNAPTSVGEVWASILRFVDTLGEDRNVRASDVERSSLLVHPLTLGPGRELRRKLQTYTALSSRARATGISLVTGEDEAYELGEARALSSEVPYEESVDGREVRDWSPGSSKRLAHPASEHGRMCDGLRRFLWPRRTVLREGIFFGRRKEQRGLHWFDYAFSSTELGEGARLAIPLVETHLHASAVDSNSWIRQSAATVRASESDSAERLNLLGVLNSSSTSFFLRQVCHNKGAGGGKSRGDSWNDFLEFNTSNIRDIPVPDADLTDLSAALEQLAREGAGLLSSALDTVAGSTLRARLEEAELRDTRIAERMVTLQEELDWQVLAAFDLAPEDVTAAWSDFPPLALAQRAFEIVLARQANAGEVETTWFARHRSTPITALPADWPDGYRDLVLRRIELIESNPNVGLIERPEHKRRWAREPWPDRQRRALTTWVLDSLEAAEVWNAVTLRSTAQLADVVRRDPRLTEAVELLGVTRDADIAATVKQLVLNAAVPHPAAQRLTEKGLQKRAVWERVWDLQRQEDRIDARRDLPDDDPEHLAEEAAETLKRREVSAIPVPPRYAKADFRSATAWSFRGKLDVPKERFVLVPGAEREGDSSPVLAWAGWDERDLARALAERIIALRENEAADAERLTPLLAGVLELLPWIHQWHPEADAAYGGTAGAFFDPWLDQYLSELGLTRDDLRAWRPAAPVRGRRRARVAA